MKKISAFLAIVLMFAPFAAFAQTSDDPILNLLLALDAPPATTQSSSSSTASTTTSAPPVVKAVTPPPSTPSSEVFAPGHLFNVESNAPKGDATVDGLKALLASLLAQFATIASSKSATSSASGVASSTASTTSTKFEYKRNLDIGSHGADVTELQKLLIAGGYLFGDSTGYFGILTKTAVIALQTEHNLPPLGSIGPKTRAFLNTIDPESLKHTEDAQPVFTPPPVIGVSSSTGPILYGTSTAPMGTSTLLMGTSTPSASSTVVQMGPPVSVSMSILPTHAPVGGSVAVTWLSANATSCQASDGWGGPKPTLGAAKIEPLQFTLDLVLTCKGPGGEASTTATVIVDGDGQ